MEQRFRYNYDKRTKRLSFMILAVIAVLSAVLIYFASEGGYLSAWIIAILLAVLALNILSIPRHILVNDDALEIHCLVEMTRIPIADISSVRSVPAAGAGRLILLLGSYGFFGYYGYYLSARRWEIVKVYAREWNHFVEIEDIYEQKYIISCRDAERLVEAVMQAKLEQAGKAEDTHE